MKLRVASLISRFKKASLMRTGGVLSLALLFLSFAPAFADVNPGNDAAGMSVRIRPKDNFPPTQITDLDAAIGLAEGEVLLQWTAPDSDDVPQPSGLPVAQYYIRTATF